MKGIGDSAVTVAIPAYNESATIGVLIKRLEDDPSVGEIIVVDDCSTDDTAAIVRTSGGKVRLINNVQRSGQTAGWQTALRAARNEVVVFTDADSMPEQGAIRAIAAEVFAGADLVGGLARPVEPTWGPSRFSGMLYSTLAELGWRDRQIIGRLFAVRRSWLASTTLPANVIANDLWLSVYAHSTKARFAYCKNSVTRYRAPSNVRDFKSQRIRADLGQKQLKAWGLLSNGASGIPVAKVFRALWLCATRDLRAALAWAAVQLLIHLVPWPRIERPFNGMWEPQASTKAHI